MAIDYTQLQKDDVKWYELAEGLTFDDLRDEVNRLYDETHAILKDRTDAEITFEPHDPEASDEHAVEGEENIGWTLGHLVAHVTATNEENALLTSLLGRGIQPSERLRTETPWREVDTTEKALQRLEESRRIVLAYLDAVPDEADLDTLRHFESERAREYFGKINAPAATVLGLSHHNEHIAQMEDAAQQAQAASA